MPKRRISREWAATGEPYLGNGNVKEKEAYELLRQKYPTLKRRDYSLWIRQWTEMNDDLDEVKEYTRRFVPDGYIVNYDTQEMCVFEIENTYPVAISKYLAVADLADLIAPYAKLRMFVVSFCGQQEREVDLGWVLALHYVDKLTRANIFQPWTAADARHWMHR